jgi:hypothetical protein
MSRMEFRADGLELLYAADARELANGLLLLWSCHGRPHKQAYLFFYYNVSEHRS